MKTKIFLLCSTLFVLAILAGCGKRTCDVPQGSTSSPVEYCDFPETEGGKLFPEGKPFPIAWITAVACDDCDGEAYVDLDYLRIFYILNGQKVLHYADEYNNINQYTGVYGVSFKREPWYAGEPIQYRNGSLGTVIKNGYLHLPVSSRPDLVFHPASTSYPIRPVPPNITGWILEAGFTIKGEAQVQVGLDAWPTSQAGVGKNQEVCATDWYSKAGEYKISVLFDKKTR